MHCQVFPSCALFTNCRSVHKANVENSSFSRGANEGLIGDSSGVGLREAGDVLTLLYLTFAARRNFNYIPGPQAPRVRDHSAQPVYLFLSITCVSYLFILRGTNWGARDCGCTSICAKLWTVLFCVFYFVIVYTYIFVIGSYEYTVSACLFLILRGYTYLTYIMYVCVYVPSVSTRWEISLAPAPVLPLKIGTRGTVLLSGSSPEKAVVAIDFARRSLIIYLDPVWKSTTSRVEFWCTAWCSLPRMGLTIDFVGDSEISSPSLPPLALIIVQT